MDLTRENEKDYNSASCKERKIKKEKKENEMSVKRDVLKK
jgi:hypothetical protein